MPRISLALRRLPFLTERGVSVPATRLFIRAQFALVPMTMRI